MDLLRKCVHVWRDPWGGLLRTIVSIAIMFCTMDVIYMVAHRAMHTRRLYALVHKYHHVSKAPRHGYADAAFTHPVEHFVGLSTLYAGIRAAHHAIEGASTPAVAIFAIAHDGALSITNHLKGPLGRFHRAHHRRLTGNYAQHLPVLDWVAGTKIDDRCKRN